jgi:hypothetical protein
MQIKLLLVAYIFTVSAYANTIKPAANAASAEIIFDSLSHDFGNVVIGTHCQYSFKFKNTGNAPLIIIESPTSCGCDMTDWSKEPVLPGKTGIIKYYINTAGRPGIFHKSISVRSNAKEGSYVHLSVCGQVYDPKIEPAPARYKNACNCLQPRTNLKTMETKPVLKDSAKIAITNSEKQSANSTTLNLNKNVLNKSAYEILVYPNPGNGQFLINSENVFIESAEVMNANGQLVRKYKSYGEQEIKFIEISDQAEGFYYVNLKTSAGVFRKKLVLSRSMH